MKAKLQKNNKLRNAKLYGGKFFIIIYRTFTRHKLNYDVVN